MKLLIAGGGTGGHLFPAIAIAKEFLKHDSKNKVRFVGTTRGLESRVLKKEGFDLKCISAHPLAGRGIVRKLKALILLPIAIIEAIGIILRFKPDFVLGVGGYSSGPVVLGAKMMLKKTGIQEQNIFPGIANRILGKIVDVIFVAFDESKKLFRSDKVFVTGNPVRDTLLDSDAKGAYKAFNLDEGKKTIFVFGGSLGAESINRAFTGGLDKLSLIKDKIQVIHQTGDIGFNSAKGAYENSGIKYYVAPFIHNMNDAYKIADIVVCRAGATSISELAATGMAAILVPYPYAAGDHQRANAKILAGENAAIMIEDKDLGAKLIDKLMELYSDDKKLNELKNNISRAKKMDAARSIVEKINSVVTGNKNNV